MTALNSDYLFAPAGWVLLVLALIVVAFVATAVWAIVSSRSGRRTSR